MVRRDKGLGQYPRSTDFKEKTPTKKHEKGEGTGKKKGKLEECGAQHPRKYGELLFNDHRVSGVMKKFGNRQW